MLLTSRSGRRTLGWLALALLAPTVPAFGQTSRPAPEILSRSASVATASARPGAVLPASSCGTSVIAAGDAEIVGSALARWREERVSGSPSGTIRVAIHVITARGEGNVTDARLRDLVQALDRSFAPEGYRFELASVDRTDRPDWLGMTRGSARERLAKEALAIDPARRLNIYVVGLPSGLRGWAQYPWAAPEGLPIHGVVLDPGVVAGEAAGAVASHEVGHYLGLLDAFEAESESVAPAGERIREMLSVYRPSLFTAPPAPRAPGTSEITPGAGAEPEDGRVLGYRGAFPNPFSAETALRFTLPSTLPVSLRVYSVTGQLVRTLVDATLPPGDHSAMFRAGDLPSGAYFAVLRAGSVQMTRTLMLIR